MRGLMLVAVLCALALPAGAQERDWRSWNRGPPHHRPPVVVVKPDPGAAFWGGVFGGVLTQWWQSNRPGREEERNADWLASCSTRYKSFDPYTGTYLGYDGLRHRCTL